MRVFVTGGTGLIGRRVVRELLGRGDVPVILTRRADQARLNPAYKGAELVQGDPTVDSGWDAAVEGCDAAINLAGHNLFAQRWSPEVKRKIRDSRVFGTENLVSAIAQCTNRPKVLVQGSAIGYYGPRGDEDLTEASSPGDDFMASVCRDWEAAAQVAEGLGVRVARIRTGIVLGHGGGVLAVMTPLFKFLPGAPVGGRYVGEGKQWMSWIHIDDIVGIVLLALDRPDASGPINGTAPRPVRNKEFSQAMSKTLWRPYAFWRICLPFGPPDFQLKLLLGEVADIVTTGQRVLPARTQALGYGFRFPELLPALADLFARSTSRPADQANLAAAGAGA